MAKSKADSARTGALAKKLRQEESAELMSEINRDRLQPLRQ
ncbi:MAG: hypothetical protein AAGN66_01615 [Acidobacteriota bacterium]